MQLEEFAAQLRSHRDIVFFTGAGISTESGVPDFRSPGGVWTKYQPVYFQDFIASEAARVQHWRLKKATYELYKTVKPNLAHYAIRDFEQRGQLLGLITQNVDGLHERAGTRDVIRLHGSIWEVVCWRGCAASPPRWRDDTAPYSEIPPRCPHCGDVIRPGVVWFGEALDPEIVDRADARFDRLWERARHHYGLAGERTSAYLNWRYAEFTTARHRFFCLTDGVGEGTLVREVPIDQVEPVDDGLEVGQVWRGEATDQPMDLVPFGHQELREVRPVLSRDARDERALGHMAPPHSSF